jgi:methionyl-tRNA formyltransferase
MTHPLRIIYMGTPDFAVHPLSLLVKHNYSIVSVVTVPDKAAGRGKKLQQSPVKKYSEFVETIQNLKPNLIVVVAFRMLPKVIWEIPSHGTFNLHASLLPQYRGAAPINWAIVNGETETGVTTFFIDDTIDTGHVIAQKKASIPHTAKAGDLHDTLMNLGGELIMETIENIEAGTINTIPQEKLESNDILKPAPKISKETCKIDWSKAVLDIYNHIRGFSPYPAAWFRISNDSQTYICKIFNAEYKTSQVQEKIGTIAQTKEKLSIACADGYIFPSDIQLEGKKRMNIHDCLRGFSFEGFSVVS